MNARDIALSAYAQAVAAEEARLAAVQAEIDAAEQKQQADQRRLFDAALPILSEWFPGVEWAYEIGGDFNRDVLVHDAREEQWPPSFKLLVKRIHNRQDPADITHIEFEAGDYVADTMSGGYTYFSGVKIKSPADLGRYLKGREERGSH